MMKTCKTRFRQNHSKSRWLSARENRSSAQLLVARQNVDRAVQKSHRMFSESAIDEDVDVDWVHALQEGTQERVVEHGIVLTTWRRVHMAQLFE